MGCLQIVMLRASWPLAWLLVAGEEVSWSLLKCLGGREVATRRGPGAKPGRGDAGRAVVQVGLQARAGARVGGAPPQLLATRRKKDGSQAIGQGDQKPWGRSTLDTTGLEMGT